VPRFLKNVLRGVLPDEQVGEVETGVDIIGDIAILRLTEPTRGVGHAIGEAVLGALKNVRVVLDQESPIGGEFRLRRLRHLAGEERTMTTHRENGLKFKVDVGTCYFSPRLSTERLRIAEAVRDGERVLNMFAGVGPFSITIARKTKDVEICSNELNTAAYELHLENNALNKVESRIVTLNGDAALLPSQLAVKFDRVLMPHPSGAMDYLGPATELVRPGGRIYYYRHVSAPGPEDGRLALEREVSELVGREHLTSTRRVREVGPRLIEMVAEIQLP
jgi:tRNA (guanine37-N1)-methyltransferase